MGYIMTECSIWWFHNICVFSGLVFHLDVYFHRSYQEKRMIVHLIAVNCQTTKTLLELFSLQVEWQSRNNSACSKVLTLVFMWLLQVFRTDLITAMKVHDSYQLNPEDYYVLADSWRQEWEKGVQVPVSPQSIPQPVARWDIRKTKKVEMFNPILSFNGNLYG